MVAVESLSPRDATEARLSSTSTTGERQRFAILVNDPDLDPAAPGVEAGVPEALFAGVTQPVTVASVVQSFFHPPEPPLPSLGLSSFVAFLSGGLTTLGSEQIGGANTPRLIAIGESASGLGPPILTLVSEAWLASSTDAASSVFVLLSKLVNAHGLASLAVGGRGRGPLIGAVLVGFEAATAAACWT